MLNFFPRGWNSYRFFITPDEFENVTNGFYVVGKDINIIRNEYKIFYERLISNYQFVWRNDYKHFNFLPIEISNHLEENQNNNRIEPFVRMSFFVLHFWGKENKLHSNFSFTQFPEKTMGLELTYPKELFNYEKEDPEVKIIKRVKCDELETYHKVYQELIVRINKLCKNMVLIKDEKEIRTNVKLSINAKEEIKNVFFITSNNLKIK
jgi:hypothetical protein